jgi:dTDP-4-amino-4,6-dideoxygalactose transaminase
LIEYLKDRGIATGIHYPIPFHLQRGYADLGYKPGELPLTEQACREVLSLPMYAELPNEDLLEVVAAIHEFAANTSQPTAEATRAHS